jgi:dihydropteroate synthase
LTDWNNLLNSVNQKVIGIVNSTNDSFSGDGVFENNERLGFLLKTAEEKEIKILDVGGVSTKPGFKEVSYEQELKRLNFFVSNYFGKFKLSVDTMDYKIARYALENNFEIVNDVSSFNDFKMIQLIVEKSPKIILVHKHPNSSDIQERMNYKDVIKEVRDHLEGKIENLISHGVDKNRISIDPGLGFGKSMEDSQKLFKNLEYFSFGFPLIVGYSKKKFAQNLDMTDEELYNHCIDSGVSLVRLHIAS